MIFSLPSYSQATGSWNGIQRIAIGPFAKTSRSRTVPRATDRFRDGVTMRRHGVALSLSRSAACPAHFLFFSTHARPQIRVCRVSGPDRQLPRGGDNGHERPTREPLARARSVPRSLLFNTSFFPLPSPAFPASCRRWRREGGGRSQCSGSERRSPRSERRGPV